MNIRLKDLRQTLGKYQHDFARVMGTKQNIISRMEAKEFTDITLPQYNALCEEYGKETVDSFKVDPMAVTISGNTNSGNGTQNNHVQRMDTQNERLLHTMAETMTRIMEKQSEQTDRLLDLLTKLSDKL